MILLNGKDVSNHYKTIYKTMMDDYSIKYGGASLSVIQVGEDQASNVYIRNKEKSCKEIGIRFQHHKLSESVKTEDVVNLIKKLNADHETTGIIVQLPLPKHLNVELITGAISPLKDVDCFTNDNIGNLFKDYALYKPCTPSGIMRLLDYYNIDVVGKRCVIVGRSDIVGKPMALMLLNRDATVTVCHSKTVGLSDICKEADILICAIGKPKFFTKNYIKDGAVVIDVGMNRDENNKLCGDVDFEDVKDVVSAITPVPGGVGQMTVSELMNNCLLSARILNSLN